MCRASAPCSLALRLQQRPSVPRRPKQRRLKRKPPRRFCPLPLLVRLHILSAHQVSEPQMGASCSAKVWEGPAGGVMGQIALRRGSRRESRRRLAHASCCLVLTPPQSGRFCIALLRWKFEARSPSSLCPAAPRPTRPRINASALWIWAQHALCGCSLPTTHPTHPPRHPSTHPPTFVVRQGVAHTPQVALTHHADHAACAVHRFGALQRPGQIQVPLVYQGAHQLHGGRGVWAWVWVEAAQGISAGCAGQVRSCSCFIKPTSCVGMEWGRQLKAAASATTCMLEGRVPRAAGAAAAAAGAAAALSGWHDGPTSY